MQTFKVHRCVCARALNNQGPLKTGVWTSNVDLKFSTYKVREKWRFPNFSLFYFGV